MALAGRAGLLHSVIVGTLDARASLRGAVELLDDLPSLLLELIKLWHAAVIRRGHQDEAYVKALATDTYASHGLHELTIQAHDLREEDHVVAKSVKMVYD